MAKDKALVGAAGVHYVAFQLSSLGYSVGVAPPGAKGIDLLAGNPDSGKSIAIQVKTMSFAYVNNKKQGDHWKWRIGKLADAQPYKGVFITFVDLRHDPSAPAKASETPDVFIIPSTKLNRIVNRFPGGDNWVWIGKRQASTYKNRWDVIGKFLGAVTEPSGE